MLTNFHINKIVADKLALNYTIVDNKIIVGIKRISENVIPVHGVFNPCECPNDAWPIIFDNKIEVRYEHLRGWMALGNNGVEIYDENPLRAAMRVFAQEEKELA